MFCCSATDRWRRLRRPSYSTEIGILKAQWHKRFVVVEKKRKIHLAAEVSVLIPTPLWMRCCSNIDVCIVLHFLKPFVVMILLLIRESGFCNIIFVIIHVLECCSASCSVKDIYT